MRKKLINLRKKFGYTQKGFSIMIGVSIQTYRNIEQSVCHPRKQLKEAIMNGLNTQDEGIFDNFVSDFRHGTASENILFIMNLFRNGKYKRTDISNICTAILKELKDRESKKLLIQTKTEKGNNEMNRRCEKILKNMGRNLISDDVALYRKCRQVEFEIRTGRSHCTIKNNSNFIEYEIKFNSSTGKIGTDIENGSLYKIKFNPVTNDVLAEEEVK